jgi:hypothetical protein
MAEYFPFDVDYKSYSGSFSGSFFGDGSGLTNVKSSNISGSVTSASYAATASFLLGSVTSASYALTASYAMNGGGGAAFPYTGSAIITGSLIITGSTTSTLGFTGSLLGTASYAANGGVTQLLAGPNISLSPTTGVGQVTISSTAGGGGFNTATGSYGSFYDTTIQTNVASTARSMSLNTTDITNGVSVSGSTNPFNTYIKVANAGVYDIQFSAQVDKTDSGTDEIWIWIRKNGTDLSDTATSVQLTGNGAHYVAAWNFFVNAAAGDYFQLMWYSPDANVRLHAEPAFGVVPGIPSLIVTVNRVDQFLSNTGSFSGSFTGSLFGTSSWATNALTASFINSASTNAFVQNGNSFGATALLGTNDNQSLAFETSGSTRMFISSSGFVGIGTITPTYALDVTSPTGATAARFYGSGGTATVAIGANGILASQASQYRIYSTGATPLALGSYGTYGDLWAINGNVGVGQGTTAPTLSSRFTIKGSGATSATTALRVENTNASASLVVLDNGNVYSNGLGYISTNTAFGSSTFGGNISSSAIENTAFGASALSVLRTGTRNTVIGYNGLSLNTTGLRNTAVGAYVLSNNSVGSDNTAVGMQAMWVNTSGSSNTAVGEYALYSNATGNNNTGVGMGSFFYLNTGSNNTVIGSNSGRTLADGSTSLSSSNNSIFVGYDAKANNNEETNQIVIGYAANGIGSNSVVLGNDSITKTALKGNVLIGTTTSSIHKLDVSGSGRFTSNLTVTGSVIATSFTGSLQGTASYATQALSASWAPSVASNPFPFTGSAIISGSLGITGSLSISGSVIRNTDGLNRLARYGTALSGSTIGTGVTAQTIVYSQLIPANTFSAGNIFRTYFRFRKLATNGNATFNIVINTSNAVAGSTTLATLTANTVHNHMKRDFYIAQGNATTTVGSGVSLNTDDTSNTQTLSVINWAVDQYLIYTVTLNTLDSGYGLGYTIEQVL